jgi:ABC-2 type transport system permease protein
MTMPLAATPAAVVTAPTGSASLMTTGTTVALRTAVKMLRSPQIVGIAVVQSVVFLFMFRYVLGGAIAVEGVEYVQFLVPGFVVSGILFTAGGSAVAVAEDAASGLYDRLRSLPIFDAAVLAGRAVADSGLLVGVALFTLAAGFVVGFRLTGTVPDLLLAIGLLVIYALAASSVFVVLGLISGSAQAAQGLGILGVPFSFLSSAFVPVETMPAAIQAFAEWQPLTFMINSWRGLLLGDEVAAAAFEHSTGYYVTGSLIWSAVIVVIAAPLALHAYRKG